MLTSPRRHSSRSSTNISRRRLPGPRGSSQLESDQYLTTASPWAAQWACGSSQLEFDQHLTTANHKSPKRYRIDCLKCRYCRTYYTTSPISRPADLVKLKLLHWERAKGRPRPTHGLLRSHPPYPRVIRAPICLHIRYCRFKTGSPGNQASTHQGSMTVHADQTHPQCCTSL